MLSSASFWKSRGGYSLVEMVVVASIVMVGSAVAIPVTMRMVADAKGDSALVMTATFVQGARSRAVSERRNIVLTFPSTTRMQLERVEVPSGLRTVVGTLILEGDEQFIRAASLPTAVADTPDKFGGTGPISFTGTSPVMFTSDGSLIDNSGDVSNGTIYVAKPNALETARAVTIWGVTGLVRTWKWRGSKWMQ